MIKRLLMIKKLLCFLYPSIDILLRINEKLKRHCDETFTNCNDEKNVDSKKIIIYQKARHFKEWFISREDLVEISHYIRYKFDELKIKKCFWNESSKEYIASQLAYHIFAKFITNYLAKFQKPDAGADSQEPDADSQEPDVGADSQELDADAIESFKKSFFTRNSFFQKLILLDDHNKTLSIGFTNILFDIDFKTTIPEIITEYQALQEEKK